MGDDATDLVIEATRQAVRDNQGPYVLAVSGGLDSMSLLSAMAEVAPCRIAAVATFDHGTGPAAEAAVRHVGAAAAAKGLTFLTAKLPRDVACPEGREAAWRAGRYEFLQTAAARLGAVVATAHTKDDQVETVLLRIMRGTGARGLAALYATSSIVRPFVRVGRAELQSYVRSARVTWVDDPSNRSREFARNRVRLDMLPALKAVRPAFGEELLALAGDAERLRRDVEAFVDRELQPTLLKDGRLVVASGELMDYDADSHAMLWPAIAGRVGLALDARGIRRIASFASSRPRDGSVPLAGGWCLEATRDTYTLRKAVPAAAPLRAACLPSSGTLAWGDFRFRVSKEGQVGSAWAASVVTPAGAVVRHWLPGDRLEAAGGQPPRRVKRYLSDAGVRGADRSQWPVVVAGGEIVWIPGVRRSDAATDRSGRPARHYICERNAR